jgi:hypothetical protein
MDAEAGVVQQEEHRGTFLNNDNTRTKGNLNDHAIRILFTGTSPISIITSKRQQNPS